MAGATQAINIAQAAAALLESQKRGMSFRENLERVGAATLAIGVMASPHVQAAEAVGEFAERTVPVEVVEGLPTMSATSTGVGPLARHEIMEFVDSSGNVTELAALGDGKAIPVERRRAESRVYRGEAPTRPPGHAVTSKHPNGETPTSAFSPEDAPRVGDNPNMEIADDVPAADGREEDQRRDRIPETDIGPTLGM